MSALRGDYVPVYKARFTLEGRIKNVKLHKLQSNIKTAKQKENNPAAANDYSLYQLSGRYFSNYLNN